MNTQVDSAQGAEMPYDDQAMEKEAKIVFRVVRKELKTVNPDGEEK